jgi:ubiquinone/menaquinone biosynthesis C-methylase UbiE
MGQGREAKHEHRAHPGDQAHGGDQAHPGDPAHRGDKAGTGRRGHFHPGRGDFEGVLGLLAGLTMSFGRGRSARLAAELAEVRPGDRVVDVGCGPGRFLREAAERGAEAVGVEPSGQMRRIAGWRTPAALSGRVRVVDGAAERIPLGDGSATVVWAVASFHHWSDPEAGLAEVHRVLQPGGRLLIAERLTTGGWFRHHALSWEQGQDLLAQVERAGFSDVTAVRHPLGRGQVLAVQARRPANPVRG